MEVDFIVFNRNITYIQRMLSMKKIICSLLTFFAVLPAMAQIDGNGYYRVRNFTTERYIVVVDNKSKGVDKVTTTADLLALNTIRSWDKIASNPASVLYIEKVADNEYNVKAQGCDAHAIMGFYLRLSQLNGYPSIYKAYQTESGVTAYLSDEIGDWDVAYLNTNEKRAQNWVVTPISKESENYFGIKPTVTAGGKHYAPFFASFPFKTAVEGMKMYYVSKIDYVNNIAVTKELTGEVVPASAPLIVECPSVETFDNKVDVVESALAAPSDNLLTGVYFDYAETTYHTNQVKYDPLTMRVLGVCADGKLGFVKQEGLTTIAANSHYLQVDGTCADELAVMDEKEYEEFVVTGIQHVTMPAAASNDNNIYTLQGVRVEDNGFKNNMQTKGIYIVGGKKVIK